MFVALQDGEWGGNVEIVVASRFYKRNIKVFSSEYSNGVLSIEYDDDARAYGDDSSGDLILAYHGNDHYNSVIRLNSKQPSLLLPSSKDRKKNNNITDYAVKLFNQREKLYMIFTPEGTRKYNPNWKKGFYYIALKAEVPIYICYVDYERKIGGF